MWRGNLAGTDGAVAKAAVASLPRQFLFGDKRTSNDTPHRLQGYVCCNDCCHRIRSSQYEEFERMESQRSAAIRVVSVRNVSSKRSTKPEGGQAAGCSGSAGTRSP